MLLVKALGDQVLKPVTITENGEHLPGEGIDGFSKVTVNVPSVEPALLELTVTENGEYLPPDTEILHADGFSKVIVNVSSGSQYPSAEGVYF